MNAFLKDKHTQAVTTSLPLLLLPMHIYTYPAQPLTDAHWDIDPPFCVWKWAACDTALCPFSKPKYHIYHIVLYCPHPLAPKGSVQKSYAILEGPGIRLKDAIQLVMFTVCGSILQWY